MVKLHQLLVAVLFLLILKITNAEVASASSKVINSNEVQEYERVKNLKGIRLMSSLPILYAKLNYNGGKFMNHNQT